MNQRCVAKCSNKQRPRGQRLLIIFPADLDASGRLLGKTAGAEACDLAGVPHQPPLPHYLSVPLKVKNERAGKL